jgi:hypothetical protein
MEGLPRVDGDLLARLQRAHAAHLRTGWAAVASVPDNPFGVEVRQFGAAIACRARPLAHVGPFNRVLLLGEAGGEAIEALLTWYAEADVTPAIEITPAEMDADVAARLARRGLFQVGFQTVLYGPARTTIEPPARVEVEAVEDDAAFERFLAVWSEGFSHPPDWHVEQVGLWRPWFRMAGYRLYLATWDGQLAGLAALWCHDGLGELHAATTLLDFRGRGCQLALLRRRVEDAAAAGCTLISSESTFASAGQRNLERAGLRVACTKAVWRAEP